MKIVLKLIINLEETKLSIEAWTSGTNDGIGCLRTPGWCPTGELVALEVPWLKNERTDPLAEDGVVVKLTNGDMAKTGLSDYASTSKFRYICEVK
jgi:hypothetical protein